MNKKKTQKKKATKPKKTPQGVKKLPGKEQASQDVPLHEKPLEDLVLPLLDSDLQVRYLKDRENPQLYLAMQTARQTNRIANAMASVSGR